MPARHALLVTALAASLAACISSLPGEPVELPEGPVDGYAPIYLADAQARTLSFADSLPGGRGSFFWGIDVAFVAGDIAYAVDTLHGILISERDSSGSFSPQRLFRVPGIMTLDTNLLGQVVFDNHGDQVTGRFVGVDSFELLSRLGGTPEVLRRSPRRYDTQRPGANGRTSTPGGLTSGVYFACFDESRGLLGGWETQTLTETPCFTSLPR